MVIRFFSFLKHCSLLLAVKSAIFSHQIQKRIHIILTFFITSLLTGTAHADDDISGMIAGMLKGITDLKKPGLLAFSAIGMALVGYGVILMAQKKNNNPNISGGKITILIIAGCLLIALGQLIQKGQKQMNLTPVSID